MYRHSLETHYIAWFVGGQGLADIAHDVISCRLTDEPRVQNAFR